jgi:hypothetical protein
MNQYLETNFHKFYIGVLGNFSLVYPQTRGYIVVLKGHTK